jgi:hypothetical protein
MVKKREMSDEGERERERCVLKLRETSDETERNMSDRVERDIS